MPRTQQDQPAMIEVITRTRRPIDKATPLELARFAAQHDDDPAAIKQALDVLIARRDGLESIAKPTENVRRKIAECSSIVELVAALHKVVANTHGADAS